MMFSRALRNMPFSLSPDPLVDVRPVVFRAYIDLLQRSFAPLTRLQKLGQKHSSSFERASSLVMTKGTQCLSNHSRWSLVDLALTSVRASELVRAVASKGSRESPNAHVVSLWYYVVADQTTTGRAQDQLEDQATRRRDDFTAILELQVRQSNPASCSPRRTSDDRSGVSRTRPPRGPDSKRDERYRAGTRRRPRVRRYRPVRPPGPGAVRPQ